jgi:cyclophilin family peptidyl-prolyl cis-trans isomerase
MKRTQNLLAWLVLFSVWVFLHSGAHAAVPGEPSAFKATAIAHNNVGLSWIDNATDETGFEIEYRVGVSTVYTAYDTAVLVNSTSYSATFSSAAAGVALQFRVRAFNLTGAGGARSYSNYSVAPQITMPPVAVTFEAPTAFSATSASTAINLNWTDNATVETGFEVYGKLTSAAQFSFLGNATSNTFGPVTGLSPGTSYTFAVRAYKSIPAAIPLTTDFFYTSFPIVTISTKDGITNLESGAGGVPGTAFSFTFTNTSISPVTSRTMPGVPAGVTFNSATGTVSGVLPAPGLYPLTYTINFQNGTSDSQPFYLRVIRPAASPIIGTIIPSWTSQPGQTRDTNLAGTFSDPDTESAIRISTTLGDINWILYPTAAPLTVANLMTYINAGDYVNTFFHRLPDVSGFGGPEPFVIQGGGYRPLSNPNAYSRVTKRPAVHNEYGIPNDYATVSMAKAGGDPNSATSEFFMSTRDNNSILNPQNGGFTVFGRVAGGSIPTMNTIISKPRGSYSSTVDGVPNDGLLSDCPINDTFAPVVMDQSKLIKITGTATIPTLTFTVGTNTRPSVASASIVSGHLLLTGLQGGETDINITATDLDNNPTNQTVHVTLTDTYTTGAARQTFPGGQATTTQNPDGDSLNNLLEYAFLTNPAQANSSVTPSVGKTGVAPAAQYLTINFPIRKYTTTLSYAVETSTSLTGTWTTIWTTANGLTHPNVQTTADQIDRTQVTIKDPVAITPGTKRFIRTRITQS